MADMSDSDEPGVSTEKRSEMLPLVVSALFGGIVLGLFVVLVMYAREPDKYQAGPFLAGLAFFGIVIALCTFVVILIYGVPVHWMLRRFGLDRYPWYLIAGIVPAIPVLVMNYPELYGSLRVAVFGMVATSSTYLARFVYDRGKS